MTIDAERIEGTIKGVWDRAAAWEKSAAQSFGPPVGAQEATGETEAMAFARYAYQDPNWVAALEHAKGGPELARRYMRRRQGGV